MLNLGTRSMDLMPNPAEDAGRLAALGETGLLDTPAEEAFDRVTRLVCRVLQVPVSTLTLVDRDRQVFKSACATLDPWASEPGGPLSHSLCYQVVAAGESVIFGNAQEDPRFRDHPAVTEMGVVAYAGVPLATSDGFVLGTLCAIDTVPRHWTEDALAVVQDLAASAVAEIEWRRQAAERTRAEAALQESEARFRSLVESANDAIVTTDAQGLIRSWNTGARRVFGFEENEVLGTPLDVLMPERYREAQHRGMVRHSETGETRVIGRTVELDGLHKDGSEFPLELSLATWSLNGQTFYSGVMRDITERKNAESARRDKEAQFRAVFDDAAIGMAMVDMDGRIVRANRALRRMLGYGEDELRGRVFSEFTHQDDIAADWELFGQLVAGERSSYPLEKRFLRRDGTPMWGRLTASLIRDADAAPRFVVGMVEDITERKEAEEALHRNERQFRSLIENSSDVITVLNADGTVRYESPSIERVLGYVPEEMIGVNAFDLVHPEDRDPVFQLFTEDLGSPGAGRSVEMRIRHKDGSWRTLEAVGKNLTHDPATAGFVVNSRDVTGRKQLEEQLRQAQRLEAVGRLAGGVAHDFNNLLTVIKGNADFVLMDLPPEAPERDDLAEIQRAAERAVVLTRQLLAFSRRQVLQPRVLDLGEVLEDTEKMLRRLLGADIELVTQLAPVLAPVRADRGQLEQVIVNLSVNARDAMPNGGKLVIACRDVELREAEVVERPYIRPGAYVLLEFSDTGSGMDEETRKQAFEPFFTTKEVGKGTGLGLSTVYGIVKQSEGFIWLESAAGEGTTVCVFLPRADEVADPAEEVERRTALGQGTGTVLLAEDEDAVRNFAGKILRRAGYQVLEAADGMDALRAAADPNAPVDLLLADMVMPRMGGRELARRLREQRPSTPVLYMSGYTDEAVLRPELLEPDEAFLPKPFSPDQLTAKVRAVLEGRPWADG